jgi:hypothetical protein
LGQPRRVYAGQNVLFVGTMNEDESTLTLSDKVLDRANVLRFPKPAELRNTLPEVKAGSRAEGYLPKQRWLGKWTRGSGGLEASLKEKAVAAIREMNDCMEALGRPFGHRMSQAMLHYVANYPARRPGDLETVQHGLADQIEQRILPKLRGLDVEAHRKPLEDLAYLAGSLKDEELEGAIRAAIEASRAAGFFHWRGFTRRPG